MKDKNYYPLGIAVFFGFMCCMIILTVYISFQYKPDDDNAYFSTRNTVDKDINDILRAQSELEAKYKFYILDDKNALPLARNANRKSPPIFAPSAMILRFQVVDSANKNIAPQSARIFITRFADSSADKDIGELEFKDGVLISPEITLEKGEWKALIEFSLDDKKAYFEQRIVMQDSADSANLAQSAESSAESKKQ